MLKIYYARPISGYSAAVVYEQYRDMAKSFSGAIVLAPSIGKAQLRFEKTYKPSGHNHPTSTDHAIVQRDEWMVNQADLVYVNLAWAKTVSIGTIMELAWAHQLGKHTVLVLEEGNIHEHAFVLEAADIRFKDESGAIVYIQDMIKVYGGS